MEMDSEEADDRERNARFVSGIGWENFSPFFNKMSSTPAIRKETDLLRRKRDREEDKEDEEHRRDFSLKYRVFDFNKYKKEGYQMSTMRVKMGVGVL